MDRSFQLDCFNNNGRKSITYNAGYFFERQKKEETFLNNFQIIFLANHKPLKEEYFYSPSKINIIH